MSKRTSATLVGLLASWALSAQAAPTTAQVDRFEDESTVVLVEVPVQVVHKGEPLRGLTAANFEIRDEGRRQELIDFEVIDLSFSVDALATAPKTPLAARRHFLLLFDLSFSDPANIERARRACRDLVSGGLHPTDLVSVATYKQSRGAEIVLGFTTDREQVEQALDSLSLAQPLRHFRDPLALTIAEASDPAGHPYQGGGGGGNNKAERFDAMLQNYRDLSAFAARSQREQREADVLALTSSLEELGKLMRGVSGRKHVVLLSEGFDSSVVTGTENWERVAEIATDSSVGEVWRVDSEERFGSSQTKQALTRAMQEFNRSDCVIEAVDIGGVRAGGEQDPRVTGQNGLFLMADQTGGELIRNFNDLGEAMGEVLERTSVTYVLAFQPESLPTDGRFHRLKVKLVNGPAGARLIHRPGYYAPRPFAELSQSERRVQTAGLIVGGREGGDFPVRVLAAPFEGAEGNAYVPVLLEIDGPSLLADNRDDVMPLELFGYAITASGNIRDFFAQSLSLEMSKVAAAMRSSGFKFWGHFELPPDDYVLRLLVRNTRTGAMALRMIPLRVPRLADGEACLLPPLIAAQPGKWLLAQETSPPPDVAYPFVQDGQPFIPAARPIIKPDAQFAVSVVAYNLGEASLKPRAEVFSPDGILVGAPELLTLRKELSDSGGLVRLSAQFDSLNLAPGEYELVITVVAATDGPTHSSQLPLLIANRD